MIGFGDRPASPTNVPKSGEGELQGGFGAVVQPSARRGGARLCLRRDSEQCNLAACVQTPSHVYRSGKIVKGCRARIHEQALAPRDPFPLDSNLVSDLVLDLLPKRCQLLAVHKRLVWGRKRAVQPTKIALVEPAGEHPTAFQGRGAFLEPYRLRTRKLHQHKNQANPYPFIHRPSSKNAPHRFRPKPLAPGEQP